MAGLGEGVASVGRCAVSDDIQRPLLVSRMSVIASNAVRPRSRSVVGSWNPRLSEQGEAVKPWVSNLRHLDPETIFEPLRYKMSMAPRPAGVAVRS